MNDFEFFFGVDFYESYCVFVCGKVFVMIELFGV